MFDLVIVGAGPAGSTLARLLPETKRVLLLDKRNLNDSKIFKNQKACGGLISPDAQKMLAKFDLGVPKDVLVDPQLLSVRVIDADNKLERYYQRNYLNIDRERFDRYLVGLIPKHINKLFEAKYVGYEQEEDFYLVTYQHNNERVTVKTKQIVGADGGNSLIRKSLYPNDKISTYVSIQKWYKQTKMINHYTAIFDQTISDYYSWTISKNNYLIVGTAVQKGDDATGKFSYLEELLSKKGYDLFNPTNKEGSFIVRPKKMRDLKLGYNGVYLVGEAAGFISPSSAEGYSYAFRSGETFANALTKKRVLRSYKRRMRGLKVNLLYKRFKLPFMYNKLLRKLVIQLGVFSIKVRN